MLKMYFLNVTVGGDVDETKRQNITVRAIHYLNRLQYPLPLSCNLSSKGSSYKHVFIVINKEKDYLCKNNVKFNVSFCLGTQRPLRCQTAMTNHKQVQPTLQH